MNTPHSSFAAHETVMLALSRRRPFYRVRYLLTSRPCPDRLRDGEGEAYARVFSLYAEYRGAHAHTFLPLVDFSADPREAIAFARRMAKERVLPENLRDVYEDVFF